MDQGRNRRNGSRGVDTEGVVDLRSYLHREDVVPLPGTTDADEPLAYSSDLSQGDREVAPSVIGAVAGRPTRNWRDIVTWESAAELKLEQITRQWSPLYRSMGTQESHDNIGKHLDVLVEQYFDTPILGLDALEREFVAIGLSALAGWRTFTDATLDSLASWTLRTLASKQHDYGHGNILRFGVRGIVVRLSDKSERLLNLWKRGHKSMIEPIEDTYLDILGYCVIALMLIDDVFELPLEKDL